MSKRMINSRFFESLDLADLTILQRFLLMGMITHADDQGRLPGDPRWIKAKIFPYDELGIEDIDHALESISDCGDTIIQYEAEGKKLIQLRNWWKYQNLQWAYPSEFQSPRDWTDRIRQLQYKPQRWVMTLNWPGSEDQPDFEEKEADESPNELPNELGISNTITISKSSNSLEDKGGVGGNVEKESATYAPYHEIRKVWKEHFPERPQPRKDNKTLTRKAKTRMESQHFREHWQEAMVRVSQVSQDSFLLTGTWFTLNWFLQNDDNYEKCLNGNYDDGPGLNGRQSTLDKSQAAIGRALQS